MTTKLYLKMETYTYQAIHFDNLFQSTETESRTQTISIKCNNSFTCSNQNKYSIYAIKMNFKLFIKKNFHPVNQGVNL